MSLNVKALALTTAVVWGGCLFLTGLANLAFPGYGLAWLQLAASIYPGYHPAGPGPSSSSPCTDWRTARPRGRCSGGSTTGPHKAWARAGRNASPLYLMGRCNPPGHDAHVAPRGSLPLAAFDHDLAPPEDRPPPCAKLKQSARKGIGCCSPPLATSLRDECDALHLLDFRVLPAIAPGDAGRHRSVTDRQSTSGGVPWTVRSGDTPGARGGRSPARRDRVSRW